MALKVENHSRGPGTREPYRTEIFLVTLAHPLNGLLAENFPWQWTKQCQEAFLKLKRI